MPGPARLKQLSDAAEDAASPRAGIRPPRPLELANGHEGHQRLLHLRRSRRRVCPRGACCLLRTAGRGDWVGGRMIGVRGFAVRVGVGVRLAAAMWCMWAARGPGADETLWDGGLREEGDSSSTPLLGRVSEVGSEREYMARSARALRVRA
jgi:hypothetical protein